MVGYAYEGLEPGTHIGMPSTSLTLVISLDDRLEVEADRTRPYSTCLGGLTTRPVRIHHGESMRGVQLDLSPSAARTLFGTPAGVLPQAVELAEVLGRPGVTLRDQMHEALSWAQMVDLLEDHFARLARPYRPPPELAEAWRIIHASGGQATVAALAETVGWSSRRLQSHFRRECGISPKEAALIVRFNRTRQMIAGGGKSLAQIAATCGYADQAHLTRDWRRFAGTAPSRWPEEDPLAFVQDATDATMVESGHERTHRPQHLDRDLRR